MTDTVTGTVSVGLGLGVRQSGGIHYPVTAERVTDTDSDTVTVCD